MLLMTAVFLWDRNGNPLGPRIGFVDLALRPNEVSALVLHQGDPVVIAKIFTAMFLHVNPLHLAGNLLMLYVFGPSVEQALRGPRYAILYFVCGVFAAAAHVYVNLGSFAGLIGASGAIGGVLGAYFVLFPSCRIKVWMVFDTIPTPAWLFLAIWFVGQLFLPQDGVANWAHVGGFMAGIMMVQIFGGQAKLLEMSAVEDEMELA